MRCFGSFTDELKAMGRWLRECGVDVVAMESTGVYWIPVYEVLERFGFEVHLVDPRATKQVSGRKSDVLDYQWIRQLMSHGLLSGAFRPDGATGELVPTCVSVLAWDKILAARCNTCTRHSPR